MNLMVVILRGVGCETRQADKALQEVIDLALQRCSQDLTGGCSAALAGARLQCVVARAQISR
jgi:hypothetical protein